MADEELKELAKLECAKLLKSEKGYNGLSYQEFWEEGMKYGLAEGRLENFNLASIAKKQRDDARKENAELKAKLLKIENYLANDIPHELMNEATNKIWRMIWRMKKR